MTSEHRHRIISCSNYRIWFIDCEIRSTCYERLKNNLVISIGTGLCSMLMVSIRRFLFHQFFCFSFFLLRQWKVRSPWQMPVLLTVPRDASYDSTVLVVLVIEFSTANASFFVASRLSREHRTSILPAKVYQL